jgi:hypothetical protein
MIEFFGFRVEFLVQNFGDIIVDAREAGRRGTALCFLEKLVGQLNLMHGDSPLDSAFYVKHFRPIVTLNRHAMRGRERGRAQQKSLLGSGGTGCRAGIAEMNRGGLCARRA